MAITFPTHESVWLLFLRESKQKFIEINESISRTQNLNQKTCQLLSQNILCQ
jgi:agmatine/peptidylarginine deiminase